MGVQLSCDMTEIWISSAVSVRRTGEPMVLFQAYCGGSSCKDLDNWGIVDPSDLRVRLVPNDWNRQDAE
jgi:hypothetical protein